MRITFDSQLEPCVGNGLSGPPPQDARSNPSPPTPDTLDGKPRLNRMLERNTEHAFLKVLIAHDTSNESRQLQNRLTETEREHKCIRRAAFLMVVLFMLSLAGLSYCAILLPEVFRNPGHIVMRGLYDLGLGSLISQVAFLGYLLWHRANVSRLHRECRLLVLVKSPLKGGTAPILAVDSPGESRGVSGSLPAQQFGMPLAG